MTSPEICRGRVSFLYLTGWQDRECGKVGCVEHGFNRKVAALPPPKNSQPVQKRRSKPE